eukprot:TRINITY_DN17236_c0_g1_i1.p1 TRINITY_DN17236_c0_g1~~TRINITY_DN17236_c0_g1_i1.p1  ORF type:complete len:112 (-),score=57.62 TRINITY_DN17236_c0_g1_i1:107-442(-)
MCIRDSDIEKRAQRAQVALDRSTAPTFLDFGDILLQKALGAAEAAGMSKEHREHMMSEEQGVSASKQEIMRANHSAHKSCSCLLYTSDAADDLLCVDLGGRRIIKKKITVQ